MGLQKVLSSQSKPTKNESVKEAQVRAVKVRLGCVSKLLEFKSVFDQSNHVALLKNQQGCRGTEEISYPEFWLSIEPKPDSDKMKINAVKDRDSDSTLFYLIPTGMREVCIQHIASGKYIGINHNGKLISKSC